jgi:hypothetical protein
VLAGPGEQLTEDQRAAADEAFAHIRRWHGATQKRDDWAEAPCALLAHGSYVERTWTEDEDGDEFARSTVHEVGHLGWYEEQALRLELVREQLPALRGKLSDFGGGAVLHRKKTGEWVAAFRGWNGWRTFEKLRRRKEPPRPVRNAERSG